MKMYQCFYEKVIQKITVFIHFQTLSLLFDLEGVYNMMMTLTAGLEDGVIWP